MGVIGRMNENVQLGFIVWSAKYRIVVVRQSAAPLRQRLQVHRESAAGRTGDGKFKHFTGELDRK